MNRAAVSYFVSGLLVGILASTVGFALLLRGGINDHNQRKATDQIVLKLGHSLDPTHPVHAAMVYMKGRLEELSGGTVTMDIYASGVLGSETEAIEQLQNGALAMTKTSAAPMEGFIPEMAVFSLPYAFRDADHFWQVLDSELGKQLLKKGESKYLRGLCYYDAGSRNFYTSDKPILSPQDLIGMKIRVMNSRTSMDMISAMGGRRPRLLGANSTRRSSKARWMEPRTICRVSIPTGITRSVDTLRWMVIHAFQTFC